MVCVSTLGDVLSHSADRYDHEISIRGQGLKLESVDSCEDLCTRILNARCLKVLRLEGNTLGVDAALHIGRALKNHHELERLILNDVFTGRLKTEIPQALDNLFHEIRSSKVRLFELNLSDNAFGPIGMSSLQSILKSPCCHSLQVLRLHNNGLGIQGAKALSEALRFLSSGSLNLTLKTLIVGRNRLENEGASAIARALATATSLEEIQAPQNGIGSDGILAMFRTVQCHRNIRILNFNDNTITGDRAGVILESLSGMRSLEVLNLGDCLLESGGASVLSSVLPQLPKLKRLILSANELDDQNVQDIMSSLENAKDLSYVDLTGNDSCAETVERIKGIWRDRGVCVALGDYEDAEFAEEEAASKESTLSFKETAEPESRPVNDLSTNNVDDLVASTKGMQICGTSGKAPGAKKEFAGFNADLWQSALRAQVELAGSGDQPVFDQAGKFKEGANRGQQALTCASMHFQLLKAHQERLTRNLPSNRSSFASGILTISALLANEACSVSDVRKFVDDSLKSMKEKTSMNDHEVVQCFLDCVIAIECPVVKKRQIDLVTDIIGASTVFKTFSAREIKQAVQAAVILPSC